MEDNFHFGVKALIRNKKGEILLLKIDSRKLIEWKTGDYWDIPGGRIKKGDSVEQTLKREVKEEIGVSKISDVKPFSMVLSKIRIPIKNESRDVGLILAAYTCTIPSDSKIKLSGEHVEFGWFTPKKASELLKIKYPIEFTEGIKVVKP